MKPRGLLAAMLPLAALAGCSRTAPEPSGNNAASAVQPQSQEPAERTAAASDDSVNFAIGNVLFIIFHELGHALIAEFELPVLGREEDAVDNFASVLLAPDKDDPERDATVLTDAITGWFAYADMTALEEIEWWAVHGPDRQRAYQIACLLYGSEAGAYDNLAEEIGLPGERRGECAGEYQTVFNSWITLLAPHMPDEGTPLGAPITVVYEEPGAYAAERDQLRSSEIMETVAREMGATFRLPRPIRLKGAVCGEPNAFWDPNTAEITVCYELVRDYVQVHQTLKQEALAAN